MSILVITVYVDERSLYKYTNFLSVISVSAFCGELKKQLEQPFPPFSENIFTGALSSLSYESYTKKEKKARPHEDKGENGYGI